MYRQFLADVRADDPARPQAQKVLAEIEEAIRTQPTPRAAESPRRLPSSRRSPSSRRRRPSSRRPSSQRRPPTVTTVAPAHPRRRALRIAGIAVGVVGLGFIGGGIGTAVAADGDARDLNALDRAGGAFDPSKDRA